MATKPENVFVNNIKKHLPAGVYSMKNNNPFTAGVADVWYSGVAGDIWIEYKWLPKQPKTTFRPALSQLQIKWLRERHIEGRNIAVVVGCPDGAIILRNLDWELDCSFKALVSKQAVAQWITEETINCRLSAA